jgi:hypothetical protein
MSYVVPTPGRYGVAFPSLLPSPTGARRREIKHERPIGKMIKLFLGMIEYQGSERSRSGRTDLAADQGRQSKGQQGRQGYGSKEAGAVVRRNV